MIDHDMIDRLAIEWATIEARVDEQVEHMIEQHNELVEIVRTLAERVEALEVQQ